MAVERAFAAAFIDNGVRHRVLGVTLRPFCPWHLFQLQVVDSPFLSAGTVYLGHLRRAVGICRLTFPDSRTRLPIFPLRMTQRKLEKETRKFLDYIGDYLHKPEYNIRPPEELPKTRRISRPLSPPPETIRLVFEAMHGARVSMAEAWMMPLGQAYVAQAMYYRHQGQLVDFMNEMERGFMAALKAHMDKVAAKAKK